MKEIRLDYYDYRIRKGQASILLEPAMEEPGTYRIPSRYVKKEERINETMCRHIGDDGDLILYQIHLREKQTGPVRGMEWVPMSHVRKLKLIAVDPLETRINIVSFLLKALPREGDSGLRQRLIELLETTRTDFFRHCYARELQRALDGEWSITSLTPPNPVLVREELRTLAHFRRHRPIDGLAMKQADELDGYEPVDWVALGSKTLARPSGRQVQ